MRNQFKRARMRGCISEKFSARLVPVLLAAVTLPVFVAPAMAQSTQELPTIVVSPTTVPTPLSQIGSSVTVITAADLERDQRRTIPDALQTVPGLNVVQTGGVGGQTSIFMRGTNSNHVKVLIDGVDAGNPSSSNNAFDFAHLTTADIEQIEVLRGPQGGLYGSDAIGGVISITTKKGSGPAKASAMAEGGSFGTSNQAASVRGSQNNFNYAFNVSHLRSTSTPVTPDYWLKGVSRVNDYYDNWTYSTKLGADISDRLGVNFAGRFTEAKKTFTGDDFTNFPTVPPEALASTTSNRNAYMRGEVVWSPFDDRFKNYFGVNYTNQWDRTINPNPDFATMNFINGPAVAPPTTNIGERLKFDWRGVASLTQGQTLVVGLERQRDSIDTNSIGTTDGGNNYIQGKRTADVGNTGGYIEMQSEFGRNFFLTSNARFDDHETFGTHTTWRVAPVYLVDATGTKLKATYGTGFKAPSLSQLYVSNPFFFFTSNPNLKPETSEGYDFGFEQAVLANRVSFGATYFRNDIKNLIATTTNPNTGISTFTNFGYAKTYGVESFTAITLTKEFKIRGDYTYTGTRNRTTDLGLARRPAHKASMSAIWQPTEKLSLSSTVLYVDGWVDTNRSGSISRLVTTPFTTVNIAANYAVDQRVTVFGRIDNLLDKQYEDPTGFMRPGLGVYGGVKITN